MKRIAGILVLGAAALSAQEKNITPGPELKGWHISQVNHHGNSTAWKVQDGTVSGTQDRADNGGIILTDARYKDFELTLELNPDFGCDSGLFLRSNEKGEAYQVMLDYLEGGNMGGIYGEGIKGVKGAPADWQSHWKKDGWNTLRVRMEGAAPHIQVWMNGDRITDWTDTENHAIDGATEGMIALQVHGGKRCEPGKFHRFRNVRIRELR
jgi:3-keto-disaccharide hydrolase